MEPKILAIIPAFNESGNIVKTITEIRSLGLSLDILVIDDCSTDSTLKEIKTTDARTVSLPFNLGIGGAVQTGFQYARRYQYDYVVRLDGDGQHDGRFIALLMEPVLNGKADMTIGSRFIPPHIGYRSSFVRRIGIHFFASLISFLTQYSITDPTSGFTAYNKKMINIFAGYYPQDFPEPEAIVVARRCSAKVLEVPVQMRKRTQGHSSIRYLKTLYYMIKVTFAIILGKLK